MAENKESSIPEDPEDSTIPENEPIVLSESGSIDTNSDGKVCEPEKSSKDDSASSSTTSPIDENETTDKAIDESIVPPIISNKSELEPESSHEKKSSDNSPSLISVEESTVHSTQDRVTDLIEDSNLTPESDKDSFEG